MSLDKELFWPYPAPVLFCGGCGKIPLKSNYCGKCVSLICEGCGIGTCCNCRGALSTVPLPIKKSLEILKPKCQNCLAQVRYEEYSGHTQACRSEVQRLRDQVKALTEENADLKRLKGHAKPPKSKLVKKHKAPKEVKEPVHHQVINLQPEARQTEGTPEPIRLTRPAVVEPQQSVKINLAAMTIQRAFRRRNKEKMRELMRVRRQQRVGQPTRDRQIEECKEAAAGAKEVLQSLEGGFKRANKKAAIERYLKAKHK